MLAGKTRRIDAGTTPAVHNTNTRESGLPWQRGSRGKPPARMERTLPLLSGFPHSARAPKWVTLPVIRSSVLAAAGATTVAWALADRMIAPTVSRIALSSGQPAAGSRGDDLVVVLGALAMPVLLGAFVVAFGPPYRLLRWAVFLAVPILISAWVIARAWAPHAFAAVDSAGTGLAFTLWAIAITASLDRQWALRLPGFDRPTRQGLAVLALGTGALLGVWFLLKPTWAAVVGAALLAVLVHRRSRGAAMQVIDQLFVAPIRERASLAAAEAEKVRLARHIHDEPLQILSGVIRRLEVQPVAPDEIEALRETAQRLREVAVELNPPVLEDLGLGPALSHLVDQATARAGIPVALDRKSVV